MLPPISALRTRRDAKQWFEFFVQLRTFVITPTYEAPVCPRNYRDERYDALAPLSRAQRLLGERLLCTRNGIDDGSDDGLKP